MIKDAQGRKWFMRFKQYREGWAWEARFGSRNGNQGQSSVETFATKALAEEDARREIPSYDAVAQMQEFFRRLKLRRTECQLTAEDP
jgi:hypothetical protein